MYTWNNSDSAEPKLLKFSTLIIFASAAASALIMAVLLHTYFNDFMVENPVINYILFGPHTDNFKEVYEMLENLKIAKKVKSIKNMKSLVLKKINYSENLKVKYRLNKLGERIINRNLLEIKKFI